MEKNIYSVTELDKLLDKYLEEEDYQKAEEISREICRQQGLNAVSQMPEDFLFRIKHKVKEERKNMSLYKRISKIAAKAAIVSGMVLLIGGSVSAAVIYSTGVNPFKYGLSSGKVSEGGTSEFNNINFEEDTEGTSVLTESVEGNGSDAWIEKKTWDNEDIVYESDDSVEWTPTNDKYRITEYKYEDYNTAAGDTGFTKVFKSDYAGNAFYRERESLNGEEDTDIGRDYSIYGEFLYGKGSFTLNQSKTNGEAEAISVITGDTTNNQREYVSSKGYAYNLVDDEETGKTRTTTMIAGNEYSVILTFTGMSEKEIQDILEDVDIEAFIG